MKKDGFYQWDRLIEKSTYNLSFTKEATFCMYIDNVSFASISAAVTHIQPGLTVISADNLGIPRNTADPTIYHTLATHYTLGSVFVTADKGHDIRNMINLYQGMVCTVNLSVDGAENQSLAIQSLFNKKGFRDFWSLPKRYSNICLSKDGNDMLINSTDIRGELPRIRYDKIKSVFSPSTL